jgi:uncharacterized membrane protein (Fun14 family)
MVFTLNLLGDIGNFITHGTIVGIPTIVFMVIPFIVGLIAGFLVKKFLKWAIIGAVILVVLAYFGVWGLNFDTLRQWTTTYGSLAAQGAIAIIGILPLGIGFFVGVILGFIFG